MSGSLAVASRTAVATRILGVGSAGVDTGVSFVSNSDATGTLAIASSVTADVAIAFASIGSSTATGAVAGTPELGLLGAGAIVATAAVCESVAWEGATVARATTGRACSLGVGTVGRFVSIDLSEAGENGTGALGASSRGGGAIVLFATGATSTALEGASGALGASWFWLWAASSHAAREG